MPATVTLIDHWTELCDDLSLRGRPYKIETDQYGRILMSPTKNYHGFFASRINRFLEQLLPGGETGNEIAVLTAKGVKVPDSVWVSQARFKTIVDEAAASIAPEICVEVLSAGNPPDEIGEKLLLYFAAGAIEVWLCHPDGGMEFFLHSGKVPRSQLCPSFPSAVR